MKIRLVIGCILDTHIGCQEQYLSRHLRAQSRAGPQGEEHEKGS